MHKHKLTHNKMKEPQKMVPALLSDDQFQFDCLFCLPTK